MLYVSGNHQNKFLLGILRDFYLAIKILSDSDSDSEHNPPQSDIKDVTGRQCPSYLYLG